MVTITCDKCGKTIEGVLNTYRVLVAPRKISLTIDIIPTTEADLCKSCAERVIRFADQKDEKEAHT